MKPVPNSAGTSRPRFKAPPNAVDAHLHIYDPRFPMAWPQLRGTPEASVAEYRRLQERIGTMRAVVVQPAAYGTDNAVTVDAVRQLGTANARGIAVLHPTATDAELEALHAGGIRGLRFSMHDPNTAVTSADMIEPLARRIAPLGWHAQIHMRADQIVEHAAILDRLPCPMVFDHMARLPQPDAIRHPAFAFVTGLMEAGRAWVKLSGPYLDTRVGSPRYADSTKVAREFVQRVPARLVWGSDWPHPTKKAGEKPDDAAVLDKLDEWAPSPAVRDRILVDNPARLYRF